MQSSLMTDYVFGDSVGNNMDGEGGWKGEESK